MPGYEDRPREVIWTAEARRWAKTLPPKRALQVAAMVELVREAGPGLRRPRVGHIEQSRHPRMKEMIPGGNIRVLFAFDDQRRMVVLLGGDKTHDWNGWYKRMVPKADKLFDRHLRATEEARCHTTRRTAGRRSEPRSR